MLRQSFRQSIRRLRRNPAEDSVVDFEGQEDHNNTSSTRLFPVARSKGFSPSPHELELAVAGAYSMAHLSHQQSAPPASETAAVMCPDPPDYATVIIEHNSHRQRSPSLTSDVDTK